jgi:hypothetical protein
MVSDKPMGRCKVPVVIVPQEVFDGLQGQIASLEYQLETLKKSTPDQP